MLTLKETSSGGLFIFARVSGYVAFRTRIQEPGIDISSMCGIINL